ncbi:MAG: ATP-binding cassette domain-containing protein [Ruminococcus sp.]
MEAVKITNLSKYYGKNRGIVDLDLTVPKGEFFGFIGPNGAGKSTTIRTLLGLIAPSGGNAKIFGMDIVKDKQAILQRVGYLPSEAAFYPGMKVKDVLKLSADLRKKIAAPRRNHSVRDCSLIRHERWMNFPSATEKGFHRLCFAALSGTSDSG